MGFNFLLIICCYLNPSPTSSSSLSVFYNLCAASIHALLCEHQKLRQLLTRSGRGVRQLHAVFFPMLRAKTHLQASCWENDCAQTIIFFHLNDSRTGCGGQDKVWEGLLTKTKFLFYNNDNQKTKSNCDSLSHTSFPRALDCPKLGRSGNMVKQQDIKQTNKKKTNTKLTDKQASQPHLVIWCQRMTSTYLGND